MGVTKSAEVCQAYCDADNTCLSFTWYSFFFSLSFFFFSLFLFSFSSFIRTSLSFPFVCLLLCYINNQNEGMDPTEEVSPWDVLLELAMMIHGIPCMNLLPSPLRNFTGLFNTLLYLPVCFNYFYHYLESLFVFVILYHCINGC